MTSSGTGIRVGALATAGFVLVALGVALWEGGRRVEREATLLLTGFGPFGEYVTNPSWEAARTLDGELIGHTRVRARRLDVAYARAGEQLEAAIREVRPDLVLCLGVAPGTSIRVETLARNRDGVNVPDTEGEVRRDTAIRPGGPTFLPSGLPVKALLERLERDGYEAYASDDAGGYLCNHVFYRLRDLQADRAVAGFVHVPPTSERWTPDRLREAVRAMVDVLDETQ